MTLDLAQVEDLCQRLYNSQVSREREEAEKVLAPLGEDKNPLLTCREILDKSRSPYAQLFAATSFRRLVTEHEFPSSVYLEMRNYVLDYLIKNVTGLEGFVLTSLIRLICRIARIRWCDDVQQRQIVDRCQELLVAPASIAPYLLGGQILNGLIAEMSPLNKEMRLSCHCWRKTSKAFRDRELLRIFEIALETLDCTRSVKIAQRHTLLEEYAKLAIACITFDSSGKHYIESADLPPRIRVPFTWRHRLLKAGVLELPVKLLKEKPMAHQSYDLLVHLAAVNISLFTNREERSRFLERLVDATLKTLEQDKSLLDAEDFDNRKFNSFCKVLECITADANLSELVHVPTFHCWIEEMARFTKKSLREWFSASESVVHLLSYWKRMMRSLQYITRVDTARSVVSKISDVNEAFIESKMDSVVRAYDGVIANPLEEEGRVLEQTEKFFELCRFQDLGYDILYQYIDSLLTLAKETSGPQTDDRESVMFEGRATWIVYIISSVIEGRPVSGIQEQDDKDAQLSLRVFSLSFVLQQGNHCHRINEISRQRLEFAIIHFFGCFCTAFIVQKDAVSSEMLPQMNESLEEKDSRSAIEIMTDRIDWKLNVYRSVSEIVQASLLLLQRVFATRSGIAELPRLTTLRRFMGGQLSELAFLNEPANGRCRTLFYSVVSRLLFNESTPARFEAFVAPIHQVLDEIRQFTTAGALRSNVPAHTVSGVFRDLRGILEAATSELSYNHIFDWLYPNYGPVIVMCLEAWIDQPDVTTPILKFMAEFTHNKTNRISFGVTSPNGYLLFRLVAEVIITYGQRVERLPKDENVYGMRLKGTWMCLVIFHRALTGGFVNFASSPFSKDPALNNAMEVAFKLMTMLETKDVLQYKKVGKAYFPLVDTLLENHMDFAAKLDFQSFHAIVSVVEAGLKSFDASYCSQCASVIDHLATYYYKYVVAPSGYVTLTLEAARSLQQQMQMWPSLFPNFLKTLMDIALFEEASANWRLNRPILALIVIDESWFAQVKEDLVRGQPENRKQQTVDALSKLMENVERNLEPKNHDRFAHQLSALKHDFKAKK